MNDKRHLQTAAEPAHGSAHADPCHATTEHAHPGPVQYVAIALILGVISAIEVALYYFELGRAVLTTSLIVLSLGKFSLVVLYFMHLKFDSRLFSTLFVSFLVMTILAFLAVLAMFRVIV